MGGTYQFSQRFLEFNEKVLQYIVILLGFLTLIKYVHSNI